MRTVSYGAACSLDGFIAGPNGSLDWLHFSADVKEHMTSYWSGIDTVVMGRKTFEAAGGKPSASRRPARQKSRTSSNGGPGNMQSVVFSRSLDPRAYPGVNIVATDAAEYLRQLKQQDGKGICVMGGGELAQSLLRGGVIDEVGLNIHPILLGDGTPFFRDAGRIELVLVESRAIGGGCILATYRVQGTENSDSDSDS